MTLGVFLIWYFISGLNQEDKNTIIHSFRTANYWWVVLSLVLGALSHLSRAYRWHYMLEPMGYKPRFSNTVMVVLISYLINIFILRAGEITRATLISKYEKIPVEKAFGSIVAERIADIILLFFIIGMAFIMQANLIRQYLFKNSESSSIQSIIILGILGIIAVFFYRFIRNSQHPFFIKINTFINGLIEGAISIFKMKKKWPFIFHTIFIWTMYVLMFYVVSFALPETTNMPFEAVIVGFVVGGLSMAITNGGLGSYPVFVASALTLYNIDEPSAKAFGSIMWTAQTLMVLLFGGLSLVFLPIYNRKRA